MLIHSFELLFEGSFRVEFGRSYNAIADVVAFGSSKNEDRCAVDVEHISPFEMVDAVPDLVRLPTQKVHFFVSAFEAVIVLVVAVAEQCSERLAVEPVEPVFFLVGLAMLQTDDVFEAAPDAGTVTGTVEFSGTNDVDVYAYWLDFRGSNKVASASVYKAITA